MKRKFFIILAAISVLTALTTPVSVSALGFGGRIQAVTYCCNGILLRTGPPTPITGGLFLYPWGAPIYQWGQIYRPGPWILGSYWPSGICLTGTYCATTITALGTILYAGTSNF